MKNKEVEDQEMQDKQNFSERCKNAIEKSYGFKIPLPKSILKIENKK
jgi:hypothetical protein